MKIKMNLKVLGIASFVFLAAIPAVSAGFQPYVGYSLPPLKKNNYTNTHIKVTGNQYIENKVTNLQNTGSVTMWATNDQKTPVSADYDFKVGSHNNITFNNNTPLYQGQGVAMGMQNGSWYWQEYAFVAGEVDFK
ncbi:MULTISPECIES: hypothetical protein [Paenibacillus]|uniref:hypothetical protein n=1 Tax=Paenibacillus TaxID=44249 RepID=UPI0020A0AF49|nr:hypothetical protein [Paenibacillus tyrfis]MCP1312631.1 hypothetical protein [Paenibacillus tyrfis]GMX61664.1 hypothetical protein Elgi_14680 [Paenibacillus elgii]